MSKKRDVIKVVIVLIVLIIVSSVPTIECRTAMDTNKIKICEKIKSNDIPDVKEKLNDQSIPGNGIIWDIIIEIILVLLIVWGYIYWIGVGLGIFDPPPIP